MFNLRDFDTLQDAVDAAVRWADEQEADEVRVSVPREQLSAAQALGLGPRVFFVAEDEGFKDAHDPLLEQGRETT